MEFAGLRKAPSEVAVILACYGATLFNLFMTHHIVKELFFSNKQGRKVEKFRIIFYALGKIAVLFGVLAFGAMVVEKRIIMAIGNYVIQILIFGLSFLKARD